MRSHSINSLHIKAIKTQVCSWAPAHFCFCEEEVGCDVCLCGCDLCALEELDFFVVCPVFAEWWVPLEVLAELVLSCVGSDVLATSRDRLLLVADAPWRRRLALRLEVGSATCKRRPASTLMPAAPSLFQRRNWERETPKRSATDTSVSPRRVV